MKTDEEVKMVLNALAANNFEAKFAKNKREAVTLMLDIISEDSVVGVGDSATIRQTSILNELMRRGNEIINPFTDEFTIDKPSLRSSIQRKALMTDTFIKSSNAITLDGKIVNIDSIGNRVAGIIFGPKRTIIVVGKNKIVHDVDEALSRIKNIIAPYHARRKGFKTPCAATGVCSDCSSPERICNVTVILDKKPRRIESTVIVVDEDMGLSWSDSWPEERINRIKADYDKVTWSFTG